MKDYLKICVIIYIAMFSNNNKSNNLNLEQVSIDFGSNKLNEIYVSLDEVTKGQINKIPDKEIQINILKDISDVKLNAFFESLPQKDKDALKKIGVRDKYRLLKTMMGKRMTEKSMTEKSMTETQRQPKQYSPVSPDMPPPSQKEKIVEFTEAPQELLIEEEVDEPASLPQKIHLTPQVQLNNLIELYYSSKPFIYNSNYDAELEVRFGTRRIQPLTRNDYDNVIQKLKSFGFTTANSAGNYYLRINNEYLDNITGKFKLSDNTRTEIIGLHNIQEYCKHNDIKTLYKNSPTSVSFVSKKPVYNQKKEKIWPVNFDDFNFRVSYVNEEKVKTGVKNYIMDNWKNSKKTFRYLNRVTFTHDDYPFNVDISITKSSDKYGRDIKTYYTTEESGIFEKSEVYEIEIEIDNTKIGPGTKIVSADILLQSLRKVIKYILGGLQGTNYPISYSEQRLVLEEYMKMIWKEEYNPNDLNQKNKNKYFIGPSSITLQTINVAQLNENSTQVNIRKDFVVTEKADGERHLMYVNSEGKIYLINMNMKIIFTGAKTTNDQCFNCLVDGELIYHDKKNNFINLYAGFDIYYYKKEDVRKNTFMLLDTEEDIYKSRYYLLKHFIKSLKPISIMDTGIKTQASFKQLLEKAKKIETLISPIKVSCKEFYPTNKSQTIFSGCNDILSKVRENRFEYETDGLIFTHAYFGVGSTKIGVAGPKNKITWEQSFKWKPPKYNTIDFLVVSLKGANGDDVIKPIFEDGMNSHLVTQLSEYKTIELRCGFSEKNDGYVNPCQDIIDDKLPEFVERFEDKYTNDYLPIRFYPTEPYDPNAGLCNIMLKKDDAGVNQMFSEENEVFGDEMIVEFSYDFTRENGWRWVPLRVRYDKTAEYRQNLKQYGNAYKVANENWKSIHNPVTEDMICTGLNIPDVYVSEDIYYNTPSGKILTEAMKNFHNLYVKKLLIKSVSKPGDTLIDFACGKAGDLPKWVSAKLSFVFGIDLSRDNLENKLNGACARYLTAKKSNKVMPSALFVNGNSAHNIKNGNAMLNDKAKQTTLAVFGVGSKDPEKLGKGVVRQYGVGESGFNVSSCQFATHYFLENADTLQGFLKNIAECTKLNGYFIGTAYDGKSIFNLLKKVKTNESIQIVENGKKIWEVTKNYGADRFDDDSSSIGYRISVFQDSINQTIPEYLINFDYFSRVLELYGFKLINREEAQNIGLPEGSGMFSELFINMLEEIKINKFKAKDYGEAMNMTSFEKKISFLNRYFVYKKIREVNTEKIQIELSEYTETEMLRNSSATKKAVEVSKEEETLIKPKVRKLSKKLLLVPATEAIDEILPAEEPPKEVPQKEVPQKEVKQRKKREPAKTKAKKSVKLIIEGDEE
jgi:hypothetical protein